MSRIYGLLLLGIVWVGAASQAAAQDFVQSYERGKLMLQQKLYFDAVKELHKAVYNTEQGKSHFGAHYFLAKAYYWLPDIQKAMKALDEAKPLAKNERQQEAHKKLVAQIQGLYGSFKLIPEVDPEELGKVQLKITPKTPFSHAHKRRYYEIFDKRLQQQGGFSPNVGAIYLPKGEYEIEILRDQCLKYGVVRSGEIAREMAIAEQPVELAVQEKASCQCLGGQKLQKEKNKLFCACPAGSAWNKNLQRCEVTKPPLVWPWIVAGSGVAAVGIAVGAYFIWQSVQSPTNTLLLKTPKIF